VRRQRFDAFKWWRFDADDGGSLTQASCSLGLLLAEHRNAWRPGLTLLLAAHGGRVEAAPLAGVGVWPAGEPQDPIAFCFFVLDSIAFSFLFRDLIAFYFLFWYLIAFLFSIQGP
jgi:hypothetical protein